MKYIKTYEEINDNIPQVGDYVILNDDSTFDNDDMNYLNFIKTSIGYIFKKPNVKFSYIKYDNIPDNIKDYFQYSDYSEGLKVGNCILANDSNIQYWSKNKRELEPLLNAKKYNL